MFRFRMADGTSFAGRSYTQVVRAMAGEKMVRPRTLERYRLKTAERVHDAYGIQIDTSSNSKFIRSLVTHKLMEQV